MMFRPAQTFLAGLAFLVGVFICTAPLEAVQRVVWPTPHPAFEQRLPWQEWAQATASGDPASALFGCVRNNNTRFHEGIDIAPFLPRQRGEATDPVFAYADGRVVHINAVSGHSSYGRYIVLIHDSHPPVHFSLYAHLRSVETGLEVGSAVAAGQIIGVMGRSAGGYTIPRERAHLHFEIGFWLSDRFQAWYDRQDFGSPNRHGNFNGMNLVGIDPLAYLEARRDGTISSLQSFLRSQPVGFIARIRTQYIPDLVRRNPSLLTRPLPSLPAEGWEVEFTGFGFPLRFTPLDVTDAAGIGPQGSVVITAIAPDQIQLFACRRMVQIQGSQARPGDGFRRIVQLLFDLK